MEKDQTADDPSADTSARPLSSVPVAHSLPEPADAAIEDGRAPAFVLPRHPIARFFASHPTGFWFFFWANSPSGVPITA